MDVGRRHGRLNVASTERMSRGLTTGEFDLHSAELAKEPQDLDQSFGRKIQHARRVSLTLVVAEDTSEVALLRQQ